MDIQPNEIIEDLRRFNDSVHVKRDRDRYGWTFHSGHLATDWDGLVARVQRAEAEAADLRQQVVRLSAAVVKLADKVTP